MKPSPDTLSNEAAAELSPILQLDVDGWANSSTSISNAKDDNGEDHIVNEKGKAIAAATDISHHSEENIMKSSFRPTNKAVRRHQNVNVSFLQNVSGSSTTRLDSMERRIKTHHDASATSSASSEIDLGAEESGPSPSPWREAMDNQAGKPGEPVLSPVDRATLGQRLIKYRIFLTALWGCGCISLPTILFFVGKQRRAILEVQDKGRHQRVLAHASARKTNTYAELKEKGILWPSEIEGDIYNMSRSSTETVSSEGALVSYQTSKFSWMNALLCVDSIFFDPDLNKRVLTNVVIGLTLGIIVIFAMKKDCTEGPKCVGHYDQEWDLVEVGHIIKECSAMLNILAPMLALFLGFFISFMVTRHVTQWGDMAMGNLWGGSVNWNMHLAALLPGPEHELLRKTVCRWTLSVWEDTHDCCALSAEDYLSGTGLRVLEDRGC
jgi:hypothetical protein